MVKSFSDTQKVPLDLLNQEYFFDRKIKLVATSLQGTKTTVEGILKPKGTSGTLTAKFSPYSNINIEKLQVGVDGRFKVEANLVDDAIKGAKFIVKAEDGGGRDNSGEAAVEYVRNNVRVDASVNVSGGPILYSAVTYEKKNFTVGAEVKVNTMLQENGTAAVEDLNAVAGYNTPDFSAFVKSKKNHSVFNATFWHGMNPQTQVAGEFEINPKSGAKLLTVGGQHIVDSETTFQGKVNSDAIVSANLIQKVRPQVKLVFSTSVDAKNFAADSHKFGMQLILG